MEHVYLIVHTFLDLILRDNVLPRGLNTSQVISAARGGRDPALKLAADHWQDLLLQYIGVLTIALFGIFLALLLPLIGFFFCCCRCAGRCGAYPATHYDKKSDSCKRVTLGVLLSFFVIAALFGAVSAFVCNQYSYTGWSEVSTRLDSSLEDAGSYFQHTGESIETLLVVNFAEMEEVIGEVLDDSGPILKKKLADITEAIAIDDLTNIVSGLDKVKKNLNSIGNYTRELDDKVKQLQDGLSRSQTALEKALQDCNNNNACAEFIQDFNVSQDLAMAEDFINIEFRMPEITLILEDIDDLINNNIEEKVNKGKVRLEGLEGEIESSIEDIKPKVKAEIRAMGAKLDAQNSQIQEALRRLDVGALQKRLPALVDSGSDWVWYRYLGGLGMSSAVLLILICLILGLFYGMCGKRPGGMYGEECCNKGSGANFLLCGTYLSFLLLPTLLVLTTVHFLLGASLHKAVCETLQSPNSSDIFHYLDEEFIAPKVEEMLNPPKNSQPPETVDILNSCHQNETIYKVLGLESAYNITELEDWRRHYGIGEYIENLRHKIKLDQLATIPLLSPDTASALEELANSKISDINFKKITAGIEKEIVKVDLEDFISRLKILKSSVYQFPVTRPIAPKLQNQVMWLEAMNDVVLNMTNIFGKLKDTIGDLEENLRFNKSSMREAINSLIVQANRATDMIRTKGPELVGTLSDSYVSETVGIIDEYVTRVVQSIEEEIGFCAPLSRSFNSSTAAVCHHIVEPFNVFWASLGWCILLFIASFPISISLVTLYRKLEPGGYHGGLLLETQPLHSGHDRDQSETEDKKNKKGKKKKGHSRNQSSYLPEYTHARPMPSNGATRFRDMAPSNWDSQNSQPPRYTSQPSLQQSSGPNDEYERPPPYYFPGPSVPDNK